MAHLSVILSLQIIVMLSISRLGLNGVVIILWKTSNDTGHNGSQINDQQISSELVSSSC